jgi:hypothetical protein
MKAAGSMAGLPEFRQNTTRFGVAGEIVLSPPLGEQVGRNCSEMWLRQTATYLIGEFTRAKSR